MKKMFVMCGLLFATVAVQAQEKTPLFRIDKKQKIDSEVYQLVYNPSLDQVYVAGPKPGFNKEVDNYIYVLNGQDLVVVDSINVGKNLPFGIALNNKTQTLYVGHSLQSAVSAVDLKTKQVKLIKNERSKSKIRELTVDESRNKVYVSDHGNPSIWVINGDSKSIQSFMEYPGGSLLGLATDAEKGKVYATDSETMEGNILVYNADNGVLESKFQTWSYCPLNITLDKSGNRIFVSQSNDNNITVVDSGTGKIINKVYLGYDASPIGIAYDADKDVLYAANRNKKEVVAVDMKTYKILERIETQGLPNTISINAGNGTVYVTNKQVGRKGEPVENGNTVMKIVRSL
ncbi:YncE family protein [Sphingobacterium spiritivorum]|uniref:YncE family protein n=1 Tax=Sphingobacterium spiritivorum TaxID=258 RepID=UPI003DA5D299